MAMAIAIAMDIVSIPAIRCYEHCRLSCLTTRAWTSVSLVACQLLCNETDKGVVVGHLSALGVGVPSVRLSEADFGYSWVFKGLHIRLFSALHTRLLSLSHSVLVAFISVSSHVGCRIFPDHVPNRNTFNTGPTPRTNLHLCLNVHTLSPLQTPSLHTPEIRPHPKPTQPLLIFPCPVPNYTNPPTATQTFNLDDSASDVSPSTSESKLPNAAQPQDSPKDNL